MDKRSIEQKYIIFLKYSYIAIFILYILLEDALKIYQVVLLLLYLINNQVRFFLVKKKWLSYVSYICEILFCCIIYKFPITFNYIVFMPTLIDMTTNLSNIASSVYFAAIISYILFVNSEINSIILIIICSLPVIILGSIVRDEYKGKLQAQNLYDKLRIREEELKKANDELESYANTIEEITVLRERNRMSREIHDNVGHALSTIIIQLGAIANMAMTNGKAASEMANTLGKFADDSLQSVRAAVRSMKPRELEEFEGIVSISEMIKNFEKLSGIKVVFRVSDKFWKLNTDQTMVIYRITQEFLSNSLRHGKATEVKIFLNFLDSNLRIYIKDNGQGCSNINEGVGLKSIRDRVKVWGGNLEYYSQLGKGFEIIATLERGKIGMGLV